MNTTPALVRLNGRGQVTLPVDVRDFLNLQSGDLLQLSVDDGQIILEPVDTAQTELYTDDRIQEFLDNNEMSEDEAEQARKAW